MFWCPAIAMPECGDAARTRPASTVPCGRSILFDGPDCRGSTTIASSKVRGPGTRPLSRSPASEVARVAVYNPPSDRGQLGPDVADLLGRDRQDVVREHREVGELALLDRAAQVFGELDLRAADGPEAKRVFDRDSLLGPSGSPPRVPRVTIHQIER